MTLHALALRHLAFEDLGILDPLLRRRGYDISYLDAGVDVIVPHEVIAADLLVVLGGPIGVYDTDAYPFLDPEMSAIKARLDAGRPTLGICLGAQMIAAVQGAPVTATGRTEIGYAPLTLTDAGRDSVLAPLDRLPVLHWHGDEFAIPDGAERLAETDGFPHQAFRLGAAVLGLQFHLEADAARIEQWLIGHGHELTASGIAPGSIRADARRFGGELAVRGGQVIDRWLDELPA